MKPEKITALAREYAEEVTKADAGDPNLSAADLNGIKHDVAEYAEEVITFLLRRYCLVEKSNALTAYKAMSDYGKEKGVECAECANYAARVWMKRLFPEIAKEVEG